MSITFFFVGSFPVIDSFVAGNSGSHQRMCLFAFILLYFVMISIEVFEPFKSSPMTTNEVDGVIFSFFRNFFFFFLDDDDDDDDDTALFSFRPFPIKDGIFLFFDGKDSGTVLFSFRFFFFSIEDDDDDVVTTALAVPILTNSGNNLRNVSFLRL